MNLKDQVISLDLAKKLRRAGVKQESLWYWNYTDRNNNKKDWILVARFIGIEEERISAFTVAELGEMLPKYFKHGSVKKPKTYQCSTLEISRGGSKTLGGEIEWDWCVKYLKGYSRQKEHFERGDTLAEAMGNMLLHLIKNNLLKL